MKRQIPIRPYYVNRPFKYMGLRFETDDVFPPQEMQCSAHRLITLVDGRNLMVARVVTQEHLEKALAKVKAHFAAPALQNTGHALRNPDTAQETNNEQGEPEQEYAQAETEGEDTTEDDDVSMYSGDQPSSKPGRRRRR